ncbi:MAG TPA: hypothetical protein VK150_05770 [Geothrix sp.]|nr:hypothetical protein [Geothrix sp.]
MSINWKSAIGKVAPWLATTLGGPAAGLAVEGLCRVVGLEPSVENAQKVAEMAAAGQLTGDQFIALQKAEQEHREKMSAMGYQSLVDLERIAAGDRADARAREVKTGDSWTPRILAGVVVVGWLLVTWFLLKHIVPAEGRDLVVRTLGTLDMAVGLVLGYYFGSSASSKGKDELLYRATPAEGDK